VFYFSVQFLHQNIDSWFNVEIDRAMEDSLELSQVSLEQRMRWHLTQTETVKPCFTGLADSQATVELDFMRESSGALEMALFSSQEHIIAFSSINSTDIGAQTAR